MKYKLLKDLPGLKKDAIFQDLVEALMICNKDTKKPEEPHFDLEKKYIDGWFEEVKEVNK